MQTLYQNIWVSKENRTLILSILLLLISFLLELTFLFFPDILENTFFPFLLVEIDLFGGTFQPLLYILHLALWGLMFFTTLIVYTSIKAYSGGRTGLLEIGAIILIYAVTAILIFDQWFSLFVIAVDLLLLGYLYLTSRSTL